MSQESSTTGSPRTRYRTYAVAGAAFFLGLLTAAVGVKTLMPRMMLKTSQSSLTFDETVATLKEAVQSEGWVLAGERDMNKSLAKHGAELAPRVRIIELCQADYASSILTTDREMATMMPCTFAVWEDDDGRVMVTRMNTGLMGKMFGGNVATVMGGGVAGDEEAMLQRVLE